MYPLSEKTLSFTSTAMPRPDVVEKTYESFTKNLQGISFKDVTLYLNIDNFPDISEEDNRNRVADIARKYFGNVILNMPEKPNFANAVKWCFSKIETYYNFHLEDDWELLTPLKVSSFNQFFISPHVQQVALRAWKSAGASFFLSPSFIRGSFCRIVANKINEGDNPEIQIRNMNHGFDTKSFLYFPFDRREVILRDLGRPWIMGSRFDRGSSHFTQWSIRQPGKGVQRLADQNSQISKEMAPINPKDRRASVMKKWVVDFEKKRAIRISKKGKII
jgi:hypothetical protein